MIATATSAGFLDTQGIIIGVVCLLVGAVIGAGLIRLLIGGTIRTAKREADGILQKANAESETIRNKAELEAERHVRERRERVWKRSLMIFGRD